jgi:hydroxyacylglutathione hydrolase
MIFTQYYLDCLSQASYLIGDETTGRAIVVDPRRDISEYVADAEAAGLTIELVIETHFHADFLSGHLELAALGAQIGYGAAAETEFESTKFADGERISLGDVTLEILHTPGHTPESISIVVYEHATDDTPYGVLTGDTLFIGDVGRPDLLVGVGWSKTELAGMLYDSVHNKLLVLPDATRVYPAHGAGSACGKNLSTDTWSTVGDQKATNYAVRIDDRQAFIDTITEGQPTQPGYFAYDAALNARDRELLDSDGPKVMSITAAQRARAGEAVIIDTRDPDTFGRGHLEGSINVGLSGRYAEFVGSVINPDDDIVLVAEPGTETEAKIRLGRIGYDRVIGHVPTGALAEQSDGQIASRLTAAELDERRDTIDALQLVDVRGPSEVSSGTIDNSVAIPVAQLAERIGELDTSRPTVVFCAGGYRSSIAASMLRANGFPDVSDLLGGYGAWANQHAHNG